MAIFLLIVLILIEASFIIWEVRSKSSDKSKWSRRRLIINGAQMAAFVIMLILPGIDTSFRFMGLIIILIARLIVAGIFALVYRSKSTSKKTAAKIMSLIVSALLIAFSMVPAFIFTDYQGRPTTGSYTVKNCQAILVDKNRIEEFENDGSNREVPVYFFYPEEAEEGEKFPLIIFSHGAFGYYESNASSYLELASHGYVVVSLDHPYHAFFTRDTDGKLITVNRDFINDCMNANNDMTEEKIYEVSKDWIKLRADDVNFVLDTLEGAADNSNFNDFWFEDKTAESDVKEVTSHIDTSKIGLTGHSMGGATAVEVGKQRDDIDAVIDIDGTMLGNIKGVKDGKYIIDDTLYEVPLFVLDNAQSKKELEELVDYPYPNITIRDNCTTYYETYFEGTLHMDYTDLPLFSPVLAKMLGSGDVDHEYCSDLLNSLEVEFFDCYLKGEGQFSVQESYQGVK